MIIHAFALAHVFVSFLWRDSVGMPPSWLLIHCCGLREPSRSLLPGRVGNQCCKCFTRRLCGSETAFGSRGTWGWGRFGGSQTDRFLLYRPLSPDRSPCLECHTSIPDLFYWSARIFNTLHSLLFSCFNSEITQNVPCQFHQSWNTTDINTF